VAAGAVVLTSLACAGCSSGKPLADNSHHVSALGSAAPSGQAVITGIAPNCEMAPKGTHPDVTLIAGARTMATQTVGDNYAYRFVVLAGGYRVGSSENPMTVAVVVHNGQVAHVNLEPVC